MRFTFPNVSVTTCVHPLTTILFTLLLLPVMIAPLFCALPPITTWVTGWAVVAVADVVDVAAVADTVLFAGAFGCVFLGAVGCVFLGAVGCVFFLRGHGHGLAVFSLARACSQSSRRVFTTANESVNLRFSRNKLSTTNVTRSWSGWLSDVLSLSAFLQPPSIVINATAGNAIRIKNHLFGVLDFIINPFFISGQVKYRQNDSNCQ